MRDFSKIESAFFDVKSDAWAHRYVRQLKVALHDGLKLRRAVYLDTNFWVNLRKFVLGDGAFKEYGSLLELLRRKTADGTLFCPISESTFSELCKQDCPVTLAATASLMEELSLGVSLDVLSERMSTEISCFTAMRHAADSEPTYRQLAWTKVAYAFGPLYPLQTAFDAVTEGAIQKLFIDAQWNAKLSNILAMLDMSKMPVDSFEQLATFVNGDNTLHVNEIKNFKQIFEISMSEAAEIAAPFVARRLVQKFEEQYTRCANEHEVKVLDRAAFQTMAACLTSPQSQTLLPTLHIYAALHAFVRWGKKHKLKANDFQDFHHACAALGYCDVFLTERPLKSYITHKLLRLDDAYNCVVVDSVDDALRVISAL